MDDLTALVAIVVIVRLLMRLSKRRVRVAAAEEGLTALPAVARPVVVPVATRAEKAPSEPPLVAKEGHAGDAPVEPADHRRTPWARRGIVGRTMEVALKALIMLAVIVYIGLPTMRMVQSASGADRGIGERAVARQIDIPEPRVTKAQRKALAGFAADSRTPIVLTYHDISEVPGQWTITPRRFAEHMASLHAAGFRSISTDQLLDYLAKKAPLPERAVLITFDDGTRGTWIYADRVLQRYGFAAVSFLVTGQVGTSSYYLGWDEIRRMRSSGRWEFQNHTHAGHRLVPTTRRAKDGEHTPFLTNRMWLVEKGRLETLDEFKLRVKKDIRQSKAMFRLHSLPEATMFAFPFGAAFGSTNDPSAAAAARREVMKNFEYAMVSNANPCSSKEARKSRILDRVVAMSDTDVQELFLEMKTAGPLRVGKDSSQTCPAE